MTVATDLHELLKIIQGEHADPHYVLGLHEVDVKGKTVHIICVYNPDAAKVTVTNPSDKSFALPMEKVHASGFFSVELPPEAAPFKYKLAFENKEGHKWESYDPYSFLPTLSETDTYLFNQGTQYEIYNKLGAHPMNFEGVDGVAFAVWAPGAKRVSVIGSFNNWNGARNPMRVIYNSGVWELFIPGLKEYDLYRYEIVTQSGALTQKSDPFGNFHELRPGTASFVYNLNDCHEWNDTKWLKNRAQKNSPNAPLNVYEFHAGSWKRAKEENLRSQSWPELAETLIPYIKEMGYTHIELMPVMEYPYDGSWGYQVTGYYAPTSRYGSPAQFMDFIDKCHQNNIGVIMDWVPAHFPKDGHGLAKFDGTPLYEHGDPRRGEHPDWGTLIFNYGRNEVKNFLIGSALFWIEKYHIDGLRVDAVASMLYLDYGKSYGQWLPNNHGGRENFEAVELIKHMNSVILERNPDVLMIAEESTSWEGVTRPAEQGGLGFSLKWNMGWMNDFLAYNRFESTHRKFHHNNLTFGMMYHYSEKFMLVLSHDEVVHGKGSMIGKMPGDLWQKMANLRTAYAFMMGHPGKKLLFMGGEFAQFDEWSVYGELNWFLLEQYEHHRQMHQFVKDLNNLYCKEKALWMGDFRDDGFEWINADDAERSVYSFVRMCARNRRSKADTAKKGPVYEYLVFICNFTPTSYMTFRVGVPINCKYTEVLNSDDKKYGGSGLVNAGALYPQGIECDKRGYSVAVVLPPLGAVVLKGRSE